MIKYSATIDVESLNRRANDNSEELVKLSESNYHQQIKQVGNIVVGMENRPHFLLLAGPSASSKTTTAYKLRQELTISGLTARVISLDDFYVDRDKLPKLANGATDYESINTLDLDYFNCCMSELLRTHRSEFPVFDFSTGMRSEKVNPVTIDEHTIIILEGLHALNPILTKDTASKEFLKLYISPTSDYYANNHLVLSAREIRLMRRIIRDYFHRASAISRTLEMWVNVVVAEVDSIIPFEKQADFVIDSTIIYEPCVYARILNEIIHESEQDIPDMFSRQVQSLKTAIETFNRLERKYVPCDSILHEFLD